MFDTERFILEIQQRDCIWNIESPLYYNRDAKRDAWIEIFNTMFGKRGKTFQDMNPADQTKKIDNLQKKWKNIRDHFKKCRRLIQAPATPPSKVIKPYLYADLLEFLIPVLESRSRSDTSIDFEEPSMEELNEQVVTDEENNEDSMSMVPVCEVRHKSISDESLEPPKKLKRTYDSERFDVLDHKPHLSLSESVSKEEEDSDKLFLLSLLPQIRPLNIDQKNFLYIEILQSIQKAKYFKFPLTADFENQEAS